MKVLFAVSNDNVSSSIIKKYQEKYKEIITSKNVYYFNAIIKELQKDKTYDAVVIGEDLEPISNNNYDTIDKFIFDKLDNISDEAYKMSGEDIPIILICSDRRTKSDGLLIKLFGIGIYNAILGNDRNIDMVCNLINKPRSKKEAKNYYKIDSEDVNYKPENEVEVSETEIKNILNHYKKIGNNEKKCIESFDSIASQYSDTQLRIIIKFLPNSVKQILERGSIRYQKLINGGTVLTNGRYAPYSPVQKTVKKQDTDFLTKDIEKPNLTKPVIIPSTMNIASNENRNTIPNNVLPQNVGNTNLSTIQNQNINYNNMQNITRPNSSPNLQNANVTPSINTRIEQNPINNANVGQISSFNNTNQENEQNITNQNIQPEITQIKRRGRPRKINIDAEKNEVNNQINTVSEASKENNTVNAVEEVKPVKRGRGRPRKVNVVAEDLEQNNTTNIPANNNEQTQANVQDDFNLFALGNENDIKQEDKNISNQNSNNQNNSNDEINLFSMAENQDNNNQGVNPYNLGEQYNNSYDENLNANNQYNSNSIIESPYINNNTNESNPYNQDYMNTQYMQNQNSQNDDYNSNQIEQSNNFNNNQLGQINNANPYEQANGFMNQNYDYNNQTMQSDDIQNSVDNEYRNNQFNQEQNYMNVDMPNELSKTTKDANIIQSNFVAQNKIVAFVGTSKNGTSFIVNNLAELLAQKGIKTAILDLTKNKNSYYMFTDNDQRLMQIATQSIRNLENGIAQGVDVNKNLTVYTSLPDEFDETENFETILQTLDNNYQAILLDCDFNTNINYFVKATEIYLVQSMDALTIQPLTQFLSELKLKNALDENKLRVIINKEMKLKILNDKMIIGGMAKYNEPSMTLQRDLFNPNTIKYLTIPFEMQTYARYLESIALCQISLSGYSSTFISSLERLANMVYPLVSGGNYSNYSPNYEKAEKKGFFKNKNKKQPPTQFSSGVNDTLNKMRTNY